METDNHSHFQNEHEQCESGEVSPAPESHAIRQSSRWYDASEQSSNGAVVWLREKWTVGRNVAWLSSGCEAWSTIGKRERLSFVCKAQPRVWKQHFKHETDKIGQSRQ
jgi:hypothetical protein